MSTLFQYYDGMIQEQPGTGVKLIQPSSFVDLVSTLKTLFWGVFGLTPPEYAVVVIENLPDNSVNAHEFTQNVGATCFAREYKHITHLYMILYPYDCRSFNFHSLNLTRFVRKQKSLTFREYILLIFTVSIIVVAPPSKDEQCY